MIKENKHSLDIKEIQAVSLGILKDIAKFCDLHGIRYVLAYGTLIGAIRHKGFIPWDDDVDIMMPRPDYEKFLALFEENHNQMKNLFVFNQMTDKRYPYGISRVCNMNYKIVTDNEVDCDMGIFVDVYPMDGVGKTYDEGLASLEKCHHICDKILLLTRKKIYCPHLPNVRKQFEYIRKKLLYTIIGKKYYFSKLNAIISTFDYDKANYVGVASWVFHPQIDMYEKSIVEDRILVRFEDADFYAPREYDKFLRITYGDYMQLPPVEKRMYHHGYVAYKRVDI